MTNFKFQIHGKRWFSKTYGNTYHSVRIYDVENNKVLSYIPFEYGYDDQALETGLEWLAANGYITRTPNNHGGYNEQGTRWAREEGNILYTVEDVKRKKDL